MSGCERGNATSRVLSLLCIYIFIYSHVYIFIYACLYVNFNIKIERKFVVVVCLFLGGAPRELVPYSNCVLLCTGSTGTGISTGKHIAFLNTMSLLKGQNILLVFKL